MNAADLIAALDLPPGSRVDRRVPKTHTTCVFRDSAFADDVAKTNLAAILQQHGLTTVRSL